MDLCKLNKIIQDAGVGSNALGYAPELLEKIDSLDESKYSALLKQLASARDEGDFRGRVLEVNFAACFEKNGISLQYGAKQADCTGDIDFLWQLDRSGPGCLNSFPDLLSGSPDGLVMRQGASVNSFYAAAAIIGNNCQYV